MTTITQPKVHSGQFNGVELCWFEWGEPQVNRASILLVHATGFHGRCWDQVVRYLPGEHVLSLEMRGHGRSENLGPFNWQSFGQDVTAFVQALGDQQVVGVGHSMGGHAVAVAAANHQAAFERLVLVDPVIMSPEIYAANTSVHADWLDDAGQHPVARRKNQFDSVQAMVNNFQGRGSYGVWQAEVLADYCEYGLLPNPDGPGLILACPPKVEAEIYMGSTGRDILAEIGVITRPVRVLRAQERDHSRQEMDFSSSPTWPELADFLPNGRDYHLSELTHFLPMQAPELVAAHILDQA